MKRDLITFRSITPAQQAQRVLRRSGIEADLQRTPRQLEHRGCGYGLRIRPEQTEEAVMLLRSGGIRFNRIFTQENGIWEERK